MSITNENSKKHVQSYICSVTFPETIESLMKTVSDNRSKSPWSTDMDLLLSFRDGDALSWTAPKWAREGDVVFFYHTHRAKPRARRLLSEVREKSPRKRKLISLLERSLRLAESYAGKIFACAVAAGPVERVEGHGKHFVSPHFVPLRDVFIFDSPSPQQSFADCVKIGRSTITPLFGREFTGIKRLLARDNALPDYLRKAAFRSNALKNVNARNWANISCSSDAKFRHEAQLRAYWLDYFLKALKDKGTSLLEECECFRGAKSTGRADYFVKIHGRWLPVEAKLKIVDERSALRQVAKYTNVDAFVPKKGIHRNKVFKVNATPVCLLIDQSGIYFVSSKNEFIECDHKKPFRRREALNSEGADEIRNAIESALNL
jgi:hypothetical protein